MRVQTHYQCMQLVEPRHQVVMGSYWRSDEKSSKILVGTRTLCLQYGRRQTVIGHTQLEFCLHVLAPVSLTELTTSRMEALQARWPCANSLETFHHHAQPMIDGPGWGSEGLLNFAAPVFSCPPARFHHERGGAVKRRPLISSFSGRFAAGSNAPPTSHTAAALELPASYCYVLR